MRGGALAAGLKDTQIHCVLDEQAAVESALRAGRAGDVVVLMPTNIEAVWQQVQAFVP